MASDTDPVGSPSNVACTSMEQSVLRGSVFTDADPTTPLPAGSHALADLGWVSHHGVAYVNLAPASPNAHYVIGNTQQVGAWSDISGAEPNASVALPVFSASVCHGAAPRNASYAYGVVPNVTQGSEGDAVSAFTAAVAVVANNERVQAVLARSAAYGGVVGAGPAVVVLHAVFWMPGGVSTSAASPWPVDVVVDAPVVVTLVRNVTTAAARGDGQGEGLGDLDIAVAALDRSLESAFEVSVTGSFGNGGGGNGTVACKPDGAGNTVVSGVFPTGILAGSSVVGRCKAL